MYAIDMRNITKRFPGVLANDQVNLQVEEKQIHCLLGENGCGKSTLMNILFGLHQPDGGELYIRERKTRISNPNDAYQLGIGMVHQHFMLVNQMTVLENIILGNECGSFLLDRKSSRQKVLALVTEFGFKLNLDDRVADLSVGMKQRVEIVKTLYRGADIIILDEPTAVLTPQEVSELFKILKQLQKEGRTIIFITHKLNETMELSNQVTVLRKGQKVATVNTKDTTPEELASLMVGRSVEHVVSERKQTDGEVILKIEELMVNSKAVHPVNLALRAGEILGIAGVEGNGQQELEELLVGTIAVKNGKLFLSGQDITRLPVAKRKKLGIGYIPADRHKNAMISSFSVAENYLLGFEHDACYHHRGFVKRKQLKADAHRLIEEFTVKAAGIDHPIGTLSGGNQQKVILGREVSHNPVLVIAAQPIRGLDIGAIEYVHKTLLRLKAEGKAILLISAELSEIMNLSDRIAVFYEGEISAQFPNGAYNKEEIGLFMAGKKAGGEQA